MADRYFWDLQGLEGETKLIWFELESQDGDNELLIRAGRGIAESKWSADGVYQLLFEDNYYPLGKDTLIRFMPFVMPQDPDDAQIVSGDPLPTGVQIIRDPGNFPAGRKLSLMVVVRNSNADVSGP